MLSQLKKIISFQKSLNNNEKGMVRKSKISDLNTECFQRLTQFLNQRDIMALSLATGLWLKDIPLVYEEIADYQQSDIVPFLENCGIYLRSFSMTRPHYHDFPINQQLELIAKCCPNIESIKVILSLQNSHVQHSFLALENMLNLKSLELTVPFLNKRTAYHLNKLKCLPHLQRLKINCAASAPLDMCIQQCRQLRILHIPGCALLHANTLLRCQKLKELKITAEKDKTKPQCRWALSEAIRKLVRIQKLHLEANACLNDIEVLGIARLPQLQHLTLKHFTICGRERYTLPLGALPKLEEAHFVNIRYKESYFVFILLNLLAICPKLKFIRFREIGFRVAKLIHSVVLFKMATGIGNATKLNILVEEFEHYNDFLRQLINGFSGDLQTQDILQVEVVKPRFVASDILTLMLLIFYITILLVDFV